MNSAGFVKGYIFNSTIRFSLKNTVLIHELNLPKKQKDERERSSEKTELVIKVSKFLIVLFTCVTFVTFGVKTFQRTKDWFDEESLYRAGVKINPPKGNLFYHKSR